MSDEIEDDYFEPPTIFAFLRSLPRDLSPQARLTMLVFWDDAGRQYGPTDITVPVLQKLTGLSWGAQQNAITALRKAGLLTKATSPRRGRNAVWFRFVLPPGYREGAVQ